MKHWHRCRRWTRFGIGCPYWRYQDHDDEEEQPDDEEPWKPIAPERRIKPKPRPAAPAVAVPVPVSVVREKVEAQLEELTREMDDHVVEDVQAGRPREPVGKLREPERPKPPGQPDAPDPPGPREDDWEYRTPRDLDPVEAGATRVVVRLSEWFVELYPDVGLENRALEHPPTYRAPVPHDRPVVFQGDPPGPPQRYPQARNLIPPDVAELAERAATRELEESVLHPRRTPRRGTQRAPRPGPRPAPPVRTGRITGQGPSKGTGKYPTQSFFFNATERMKELAGLSLR